MPQIALHPTTARQLERFIESPSHAVLITGAAGMGKASVAEYVAEQLLNLPAGKLADYAYLRRINSVDGKAIGIEPVRELEHFLSLKVPGERALKRMIIIENSHLLGGEAQNALLKTLEEPPIDTVIIMTATTVQSLLPTIQSRLQTIAIIRPAKTQLIDSFAEQGVNVENFDTNYTVSGGLPGLAHAMATNGQHPLLAAVVTARTLLGQSGYERLLQVDVLAKDKQLAQDTLTILQQMAHISLQTASGPSSKRWQAILSASYNAAKDLSNSGQPKLVLTHVMLSM